MVRVSIEERLQRIEDRLEAAEREISDDRKETAQLVDYFRGGSVLAKIFMWLVIVGAAIGTIWASFFHAKSP